MTGAAGYMDGTTLDIYDRNQVDRLKAEHAAALRTIREMSRENAELHARLDRHERRLLDCECEWMNLC